MARELIGIDVSKAYRCAKVGLNAGTLRRLGRGDVDLAFSDRLFKCMGSGTPYLTPPITNICEWFTPGEDLLVYETKRELVQWIRYLLENETERARIGRNGMNKIMRDHTIDLRVSQYQTMIDNDDCFFECRHGAARA